jgi:hypothetical protein
VLKVAGRQVDASHMPESRVRILSLTAGAVHSEWNDFIERFGITAAIGLLAATLVQCVNQNAGIEAADPIPGLQLFLVLIVVSCVGVLSYRQTHAHS